MSTKASLIITRSKNKQLYKQLKKYKRQAYYARKFRDKLLANNPVGSDWSKNFWGLTYDATKANKDSLQYLARRGTSYYGPGDYTSFLSKWIPQGTFAHLGRTAGAWTGIPGLNAAGAFAGHKLSKYLGFGDYSTNQIIGGGSGDQQQIAVNQDSATGDVYMSKTEFVANVTASGSAAGATTFQIKKYGLNPALAETFPSLSQVAQNFELYDFQGLVFQFKPTFSEDAGTSASLGKVIMATNYDPNAAPFFSSVQMENYDYANSTKPSCGAHHGVETAQSQQFGNMLYTRTGTTSKDLIFTDLGSFYIATEGIPISAAGTVIVGELWVTYRVKLSRMQIFTGLLGNNILSCVLSGTADNTALSTGTTAVKSSNTQALTVLSLSPTKINVIFPASTTLGTYCITMRYLSSGTPFTTQALTAPTSLNQIEMCYPGSSTWSTTPIGVQGPSSPVGTTNNSSIMGQYWVSVNAPGTTTASFEINTTAALTAGTTWRLICTQVPNNIGLAIA